MKKFTRVDSGVLAIALLAVLAAGCEQKYELSKSTSVSGSTSGNGSGSGGNGGPITTTDSFSVKAPGQDTKVDILFVIDNSGSMADEQAALANAFDAFITKFVDKGVDYHIGITSTDGKSYSNVSIGSSSNPYYGYHNPFPQSNSTPGTLLMRNQFPQNPNYITSVSGSKQQIIDQFKANSNLGTKGDGSERVIYDALLALSPEKLSNENAYFRRSDALLSVIGVTDENEEINSDPVIVNGAYDHAETTPQQRIDRFKAYMPYVCGSKCPGWRVDLIVDLNAAVHDTSYPLDAYASGTYPYPDFYKKFAAQTGSSLSNIYSKDWGANLASIANNIITAAESQFKLSYAPLPGSLKVYLNNVAVAANSANGYVYNSSTQTIELKGSTLSSAPGKTLKVEYLRN
jgi:hypothetical protein